MWDWSEDERNQADREFQFQLLVLESEQVEAPQELNAIVYQTDEKIKIVSVCIENPLF